MDEIKKNQDELSEDQLDKVSGGTRIDPNTVNPEEQTGDQYDEEQKNRDEHQEDDGRDPRDPEKEG